MSAPPSLVRLVPWAQRLLGEVLGSGDLAVDLTAGTGRDTLFLFRCVGPQGRILAFDIQDKALRQTGDLLKEVDALIRSLPSERWEAMRLQVANNPGAPFLLAAGKRQ